MKKYDVIDWNFWTMLAFGISCLAASGHYAFAAKTGVSEKCVIRLDNRGVATVQISVNGTVLDFPVKPSEVILGRKDSFGIKYVQSDLAVSPLSGSSRSHLYVYLEGRRFTFDLSTISGGGCPTILVRDSRDTQVTVDGFFRPKK